MQRSKHTQRTKLSAFSSTLNRNLDDLRFRMRIRFDFWPKVLWCGWRVVRWKVRMKVGIFDRSRSEFSRIFMWNSEGKLKIQLSYRTRKQDDICRNPEEWSYVVVMYIFTIIAKAFSQTCELGLYHRLFDPYRFEEDPPLELQNRKLNRILFTLGLAWNVYLNDLFEFDIFVCSHQSGGRMLKYLPQI